MLDVRPTRDVDAMMKVIERPGIWKHITGGQDNPANPMPILQDPINRFFLVTDYGTNLGFTGYVFVEPGIYAIHNCLLTIGSRSVDAISRSLAMMAEEGACMIISAYPADNKAARLMALRLGFQDDCSGLVRRLLPFTDDYLYQFKEVSKITTK